MKTGNFKNYSPGPTHLLHFVTYAPGEIQYMPPGGNLRKERNEGKDTGELHEATRGTKWGRGEFDRGLSEVTNYQEKDKNDIKKDTHVILSVDSEKFIKMRLFSPLK